MSADGNFEESMERIAERKRVKTLREEVEWLVVDLKSGEDRQEKLSRLLAEEHEELAAREVLGKSKQCGSIAKFLQSALDRTQGEGGME